MIYQSFSTLTGNPKIVHGTTIGLLRNQIGITAEEAMYCLMLAQDNVVVLNGTTKQERMIGGLAALEKVREWAVAYPDQWRPLVERFRTIIDGLRDPYQ